MVLAAVLAVSSKLFFPFFPNPNVPFVPNIPKIGTMDFRNILVEFSFFLRQGK
jgi:hypothetical protein